MKKTSTYLTLATLLLGACISDEQATAQGSILGSVQTLHHQQITQQRLRTPTLDVFHVQGNNVSLPTLGDSEHDFIRTTSEVAYQIVSKPSKHLAVRYGYHVDKGNHTGHFFALAQPMHKNKVLDTDRMHYDGDLLYRQTDEKTLAIYAFSFNPKDGRRFEIDVVGRAGPEDQLLPIEGGNAASTKNLTMTGKIIGNRFVGKVTKLTDDEDQTFSVRQSRVEGYFAGENASSLSGTFYGKTEQFGFAGSFGGFYTEPVCLGGGGC